MKEERLGNREPKGRSQTGESSSEDREIM